MALDGLMQSLAGIYLGISAGMGGSIYSGNQAILLKDQNLGPLSFSQVGSPSVFTLSPLLTKGPFAQSTRSSSLDIGFFGDIRAGAGGYLSSGECNDGVVSKSSIYGGLEIRASFCPSKAVYSDVSPIVTLNQGRYLLTHANGMAQDYLMDFSSEHIASLASRNSLRNNQMFSMLFQLGVPMGGYLLSLKVGPSWLRISSSQCISSFYSGKVDALARALSVSMPVAGIIGNPLFYPDAATKFPITNGKLLLAPNQLKSADGSATGPIAPYAARMMTGPTVTILPNTLGGTQLPTLTGSGVTTLTPLTSAAPSAPIPPTSSPAAPSAAPTASSAPAALGTQVFLVTVPSSSAKLPGVPDPIFSAPNAIGPAIPNSVPYGVLFPVNGSQLQIPQNSMIGNGTPLGNYVLLPAAPVPSPFQGYPLGEASADAMQDKKNPNASSNNSTKSAVVTSLKANKTQLGFTIPKNSITDNNTSPNYYPLQDTHLVSENKSYITLQSNGMQDSLGNAFPFSNTSFPIMMDPEIALTLNPPLDPLPSLKHNKAATRIGITFGLCVDAPITCNFAVTSEILATCLFGKKNRTNHETLSVVCSNRVQRLFCLFGVKYTFPLRSTPAKQAYGPVL